MIHYLCVGNFKVQDGMVPIENGEWLCQSPVMQDVLNECLFQAFGSSDNDLLARIGIELRPSYLRAYTYNLSADAASVLACYARRTNAVIYDFGSFRQMTVEQLLHLAH